MKEIYLDNAAATPVDQRVIIVMAEAAKIIGNPSSFNDAGRRAQTELTRARRTIARFLNARGSEIIFCASGSEANNLAILGLAGKADARHRHLITTPIEHLSVLEPAKALGKRGWQVVYASVDDWGRVKAEDVVAMIDKKTSLVSVMYANNEIGTIQDIARIGRRIIAWRRANRSPYPLFHIDACQTAGYLDMDVQRLGVDLLTFNGSKIHGPRGSAVLYVRRGVQLSPLVSGGSQEFGLRAGTENVPAAVGLARAVQLIKKGESEKTSRLRDYFLKKVLETLPDVRVNGPLDDGRLANNINISIPGADSETLLLELDKYGIRAGSGSACTAHTVEPSHVLKAIGTPKKYLDGVLRFSLSRQTTKKEIDILLKVLPDVVKKSRARTLK